MQKSAPSIYLNVYFELLTPSESDVEKTENRRKSMSRVTIVWAYTVVIPAVVE